MACTMRRPYRCLESDVRCALLERSGGDRGTCYVSQLSLPSWSGSRDVLGLSLE